MKAVLIDPTSKSIHFIELTNDINKLLEEVGNILGTTEVFHGKAEYLPVYIFGNFTSPWDPESLAFTHPFQANSFVGKTIVTGYAGNNELTHFSAFESLEDLKRKIFFFDKEESELWKKVHREYHEEKNPKARKNGEEKQPSNNLLNDFIFKIRNILK